MQQFYSSPHWAGLTLENSQDLSAVQVMDILNGLEGDFGFANTNDSYRILITTSYWYRSDQLDSNNIPIGQYVFDIKEKRREYEEMIDYLRNIWLATKRLEIFQDDSEPDINGISYGKLQIAMVDV